MGIEPTSQPWQGRVLTVVLHLHGISIAISGPARLSLFIIYVGKWNQLWRVVRDDGFEPPTPCL